MRNDTENTITIEAKGSSQRSKVICPCGHPVEAFVASGVLNLRDGCGHLLRIERAGETWVYRFRAQKRADA
jgi:hypothetical protein